MFISSFVHFPDSPSSILPEQRKKIDSDGTDMAGPPCQLWPTLMMTADRETRLMKIFVEDSQAVYTVGS